MGRLYDAGYVLEITGISRSLFNQWIYRGLVIPDVLADGAGTRNRFEAATICQIEVFKRLNSARLSRKQSSKFAFRKNIKDFIREIFRRGSVEDYKLVIVAICFSKNEVYTRCILTWSESLNICKMFLNNDALLINIKDAIGKIQNFKQ